MTSPPTTLDEMMGALLRERLTTSALASDLLYQSLWQTTVPDAITTAEPSLRRWLSQDRRCGGDADLTRTNRHQLSKYSQLLVDRSDDPEQGLARLRLTIWTTNPEQEWVTRVLFVEDTHRGRASVLTRVHCIGHRPEDGFVGSPEVLFDLTRDLVAVDGGHRVRSVPQVVCGCDEQALDHLVGMVTAPDRHLPVLITGTPADVSVGDWHMAVQAALVRCWGMASTYVLDSAAQEHLRQRLPADAEMVQGGVTLCPPPAGPDSQHRIRTFARWITPDAIRDAWMQRYTLARHPQALALAQSVRESALAVEVPADLREANALMDEETTTTSTTTPQEQPPQQTPTPASPPVDRSQPRAPQHTPAPATDTEPSTPVPARPHRVRPTAQEHEVLKRQIQTLREEITKLNGRISELSEERQGLLAETVDLGEDLDIVREQVSAARHEARWLREQAREAGLFRLAGAPAPSDPQRRPPVSVREFLEWITDGSVLPHLYFTIEDATVYELSDSRKEALWVTRAWEALLALNDYARYQFDNPGARLELRSYLREAPDGYQVIPGRRLAPQESEPVRTRDKLNDKRLFRVPEEVAPAGRVPMYAHIKLDVEYGICPRLYFYPHLGPGTTNRIYIGYLGRHLPVSITN